MEEQKMKLKSFQIINYKSILDSGKCYVNSALTIFAGQNESGKTNILSALQHLLTGAFDKSDYPARSEDLRPQVIYNFSVDPSFFDSLDPKLNDYLKQYDLTTDEFEIVLDENGNINLKDGNILLVLKERIDGYNKNLTESLEKKLKELGVDPDSNEDISLTDIKNEMLFSEMVNKEQILQSIEDYESNRQCFDEDDVIKKLKGVLPRFIYFDSFKDNLPDVIKKEHLCEDDEHHAIVERLFRYLNADPKKIFLDDISDDADVMRNDYLKSLSKHISDDLFAKYAQKPIKLNFRMTAKNGLRIEVYDADKAGNIPQGDLPYNISDRSAGFRWFLSFYITLRGENFSDGDVVLIDEPGLYLHAKAQRDMLKVFLDESKNHQFIFTTHSPYLIDVNNLSRIRLIQKSNKEINGKNFNETKIISSIIKGADNETLTPILDAIGYNINEGLSLCPDGMAIVEGPSDYYYITRMSQILKKPLNKGLIPAGGASKIGNICAVLFGFNIKSIVCLYDTDAGGKDALGKNEEILKFDNITHKPISNNDNYAIEDMFSKNDFSKHILTNPKCVRNSKLVEKSNKTALAKNFVDKDLTETDFDNETIANFSNVIDIINENLKTQ